MQYIYFYIRVLLFIYPNNLFCNDYSISDKIKYKFVKIAQRHVPCNPLWYVPAYMRHIRYYYDHRIGSGLGFSSFVNTFVVLRYLFCSWMRFNIKQISQSIESKDNSRVDDVFRPQKLIRYRIYMRLDFEGTHVLRKVKSVAFIFYRPI